MLVEVIIKANMGYGTTVARFLERCLGYRYMFQGHRILAKNLGKFIEDVDYDDAQFILGKITEDELNRRIAKHIEVYGG